jgi:hypothetical protein
MIDEPERHLHECLRLEQLSEEELRQQIALYIEAAALKPLVSSGVAFEHVAEAFLELAVEAMQKNRGRLAAALMLQRATRHAFRATDTP